VNVFGEVVKEGEKELTVCNVHPCVLHVIRDTDIFRRV
jgi:hypothetical protein